MAIIRRQVFTGPTIYFGFRGVNYYRDRVRDAAEIFINEVIGLDRVITVSEHATSSGPFSVAIWYRAEDGARASESVNFTHGMLRETRGFDVIPARSTAHP